MRITSTTDYCFENIATLGKSPPTKSDEFFEVFQRGVDSQLVAQLDDLCYLYLDFCFDHLYFTIQITEKYSIVLCQLTPRPPPYFENCLALFPKNTLQITFWIENDLPPRLEKLKKIIQFGGRMLPLVLVEMKVILGAC